MTNQHTKMIKLTLTKIDQDYWWCIKLDGHPKEWMELKQSPFSKVIHTIMIKYLTFEIVLHNTHKFYAPVTPS